MPAASIADSSRPRLTWRVVMAALALFMVVVQVVLLDLQDDRLSVPFAFGGDAHAGGMLLKTVVEHGWVDSNPDLGAPLGQHILDQPQPDVLHLFLGGAVLGRVTGNWAAGMNVYYLAVPVLAALAMAWLLRKLGVAPWIAFVVAALFGMAPYHFLRSQYHLFLGATYPIPLAAFLVLGALGVLPLFTRNAERAGLRAWVTLPSLATIGAAVVVAASGAYYAVFTLLLLGVAVVVRLIVTRSVRAVLPTVAVGGLVALVLFLCLAPGLFWRLDHGPNPGAIERPPADSEVYALKPAQLVLPHPSHRIERLRALSRRYLETFPLPSEASQALGLVGAAGLVGSVGSILIGVLGGRREGDEDVRRMGGINLVLVLYGTVGGASALLALSVTSQFRAGNRVSIYIAAFSLIAVALWLDGVYQRWRPDAARRRLFGVALAGLLVVGLFDQTSWRFAPPSHRFAEWDSDEALVTEIEQRLGDGGMVYQLPFIRFPETPPPGRMMDYDHLRGYLHSDTLKWSYGGMKNRVEGEWPARLIGFSPAETLRAVSVLGFRGVYVDRFGYADSGAAVESGLRQELGGEPVVSRNGRLSFFDIRAYADRVRAELPDDREAAIRRLLLATPPVYGPGFYPTEESATERWTWMGAGAELTLVTDSPSDAVVPVHLRVQAGHPGSWPTTLIDAEGGRHPFVVTEAPTGVTVQLRLRSEKTTVRIETTAPDGLDNDPRVLHMRVFDVHIGDADLHALLAP